MDEQWKKNDAGRWICPFNREVSCTDRKCQKCGWYPSVARYRLLKARYDLLQKSGIGS